MGQSMVEILLESRTKFNYLWLRDNCRCDKCIHPSSQQKLHSSGQIFKLFGKTKPQSIQRKGDKIVILWPDGHESVFDLEWLKTHHSTANIKPLVEPIIWDKKSFTKINRKIDYSEFQTIEGFQAVLKQLRDYGLCFLENVPTENDQVEKVAQEFGTIKDTFYGKTWDVRNIKDSKNIAYTSLYLGLHMDLTYTFFNNLDILKRCQVFNFCIVL